MFIPPPTKIYPPAFINLAQKLEIIAPSIKSIRVHVTRSARIEKTSHREKSMNSPRARAYTHTHIDRYVHRRETASKYGACEHTKIDGRAITQRDASVEIIGRKSRDAEKKHI